MGEESTEIDYDRELYRCPISSPFSSEKPKLTKKLYSLIKKAITLNGKKGVVKGIKDVTKSVRKGRASGLVVIAADVSPYDVVSHLPCLFEEKKVPFVWVPSRKDLGAATQSKRATTVVMLKPNEAFQSSMDKCIEAINEIAE